MIQFIKLQVFDKNHSLSAYRVLIILQILTHLICQTTLGTIIIIIPISQMGKQRYSQVHQFAQGHPATKG